MFVPRVVRLKATKTTAQKSTTLIVPLPSDAGIHQLQSDSSGTAPPVFDQKITVPTTAKPPSVTFPSNCLRQILCGIELIFTDYAHQDPDGARWLQTHYRVIDGEANYIHLSAILEHPNISGLKPPVTQPTLVRALQAKSPKSLLEVSQSGYHVRREPSSYPLEFIPKDSFEMINEDGQSFWDQRMIYVEPHIRDLCKTPAKVAWWLEQQGEVRDKWLPIQHVQTLHNSCAFVMLSGNVHPEGVWKKWREKGKPDNWKVLTRAEHTHRTNEYLKLLQQDNPKMLEKKQEPRWEQEKWGNPSIGRNKNHGSNALRPLPKPQRAAPYRTRGLKREFEEALPIRNFENDEQEKETKRTRIFLDY